eukprot:CAMPEP_0184489662 /NCGR_PEP_ID=MMETSP0113_2-20130426/16058_1 /TAXON_ID=91329 /ORGANISM="Norrisiella sphaerica, Strain BC52" /LENGTH=249 /DNA_ID=CAMNT_0026873209 /DNA_START=31 /DNA_END=777 /DNA_ORIENTATION=+
MGLFDKIKDGFKKAVNDVQKEVGHVTKQIDKTAKDISYKAGDAIKDVGYIAGDEIKDVAYKVGDELQKEEVQQALAGTGIALANVATAGAFAPELMVGGLAIQAGIESAHSKSLPYNTMLQAGTQYATGELDLKTRGPGVSSYSEGFSRLKDEGMKRFDDVKGKLKDEAMRRYDNVKTKVENRLGFDPTQIRSTDDAINMLRLQIDRNRQLEQQIMDIRSGKALENLTNKAKSELKKEVSSQGNKILND